MNRFRLYFKRIRYVLKLGRVDRDKYAAMTTICIATAAIVVAIVSALQPQFKALILNLIWVS